MNKRLSALSGNRFLSPNLSFMSDHRRLPYRLLHSRDYNLVSWLKCEFVAGILVRECLDAGVL